MILEHKWYARPLLKIPNSLAWLFLAACDAASSTVTDRAVDLEINHVLIGGQSLSLGALSEVLSIDQPFGNLSFSKGVRAGWTELTEFVPLVETQESVNGETIASGMANAVAARGKHIMLFSAHGRSGQPYSQIKKGSGTYTVGMLQVTAAANLATLQGQTYALRAVALIHGESDHLAKNAAYASNLVTWQSDYETDAIAITGQPEPVPMFLCQLSSFTAFGSSTSLIPQAQLQAARLRPGRIFVVGPKYVLPYVGDGVHLTGHGERWLGEQYAKAYRRVVIEGQPWLPLSPAKIERDGADINITFEVPAPPLVFDEDLVVDPGHFGFEFTDDSGNPPKIVKVELVDSVTVRVTLASPAIGTQQRIRYAYTGVAGAAAGPKTGARGNLRDSDATKSLHGYPLYNWAVHFDEPIP